MFVCNINNEYGYIDDNLNYYDMNKQNPGLKNIIPLSLSSVHNTNSIYVILDINHNLTFLVARCQSTTINTIKVPMNIKPRDIHIYYDYDYVNKYKVNLFEKKNGVLNVYEMTNFLEGNLCVEKKIELKCTGYKLFKNGALFVEYMGKVSFYNKLLIFKSIVSAPLEYCTPGIQNVPKDRNISNAILCMNNSDYYLDCDPNGVICCFSYKNLACLKCDEHINDLLLSHNGQFSFSESWLQLKVIHQTGITVFKRGLKQFSGYSKISV